MEYKISDHGAIDFLCFYLLGVTQKDIGNSENEDCLLFKCANRAYIDLNRTLKFLKVSKEKQKDLEKQKKIFREDISRIIVDRINILLNEEVEGYDKWHEETCDEVINKAKEYEYENLLQERFYYGQAQKWVNMTIKYMWVIEKWKDKLDKLIDVLHVPVDSYILQGVWEDETLKLEDKKAILDKVFKEKGKERLTKQSEFNDQSVCSWSKWEKTSYIDFQEKLREKLEGKQFTWEGKTWIEIARKRNLKQKDN